MMELDPDEQQGLKIASNYGHFRDDLLAFDPKRFRGLGEAHTAAFIAHAVRVCDRFRVEHYEAVWTVMQGMCFLGSHMLTDPRFVSLTETLRSSTQHGDARLPAFKKELRAILLTLAGPDLVHYRAILRAWIETESRKMDPYHARAHLLTALPTDLRAHVESWYPQLAQNARSAIAALTLDAQKGQLFCLVCAAAIGHGFYRDPLYPWIPDLALKDPGAPAAFRTDRLLAYANKRITRQSRIMEAYYGV